MTAVPDSLTQLSIIPVEQVTADQRDQQLHPDKRTDHKSTHLTRTLLT